MSTLHVPIVACVTLVRPIPTGYTSVGGRNGSRPARRTQITYNDAIEEFLAAEGRIKA